MKNLLLAAMLFCTNIAIAQGTIEDYRRAYSAGEKFSANKVFYSNVNPEWIGKTHYFWYVRNTPDGRIYVLVDADTQNRKDLFDHKLVAAALSEASGQQNRSHFSLSGSSVCQQRTGYATFRFQQSSLDVCHRQKSADR